MREFEGGGKFSEDRSKFFAMSAPGCVELNEEIGMVFQYLREITVLEGEDALLASVCDGQHQQSHDYCSFKHLNYYHHLIISKG